MKRIITLIAAIAFLSILRAQQREEVIVPIATTSVELTGKAALDLQQNFTKTRVFDLDLTSFYNYFDRSESSGKFRLSLPNGPITVSWVEKKLLADDYQLVSLGDNGQRNLERYDVKTYEGYLLDAPQYSVAITISKKFINMMIEQPDGNYYIEQIERFSSSARGSLVYYRASDFIDTEEHTCGSVRTEEQSAHQQIREEVLNAERAAAVCYRVEVSIASDQLMYNRYGSAQAVQAHTLSVWNNVTTNYKKNFANDYEFKILKHLVATTGSALPISSTTDASQLLGAFKDWAIKNNGFNDNKFDIAQMWTTRDISGGVVGIAYLNAVCTDIRAQLIEDFSKSADELRLVVAHETGHNFDIEHDAPGSPYIMAPAVNKTSQWSSQSKSQLNAYVNSLFTSGKNCLSSCATPGQKPQVDFTTSSLAICKGSKIKFSDNSTNDPTAWLWTFSGGTPAQSIGESPEVVYTLPGVYDVTVKVTNAYGSTTVTKTKFIFVGEASGNYCKSPGTQATKAGVRSFKIGNMSNSSGSVQQDGNKYKDYSCTHIATVQPNTVYDCELEVGDCASNLYEGIQLYADYNFDNDFDDIGEFIGYSSFLYCGAFSFKMTTPANPIENKILRLRLISSTSKTLILDPCTPPTEGQTEDYGLIFQCPTPCGAAGLAPVPNFTTVSSTLCKGGSMQFKDRSLNHPSQWEWTFPGGTPATSTEENPTVTYANTGIFDVTLKVTNTKGTVTIEKKKYIAVDVVTNNSCFTPATLNTKAGLKGIKLANLTNVTGGAQQDGNRYMDFSCTKVATLQPNTSYDLELDLGDCATNLKESYRVYIDYNNDGDFTDAGEVIATSNSALQCGNQTYSATGTNKALRFTTPSGVIEGKVLRLRIVTQSSAITGTNDLNPCYNPTDGQVEDYGIIFKSSVFAINADVKNSQCYGYDNGSIKLNPAGGKSPYNFDWNVNSYDGKGEATDLKPGDYAVTITDADGLFLARKFTITQPDSIVYGVVVTRAQCSEATGTAELAPVGGGGGAPFSFAWSHNPDEKNSLVENLYGGVYFATITDGKGCKIVAKAVIDSTVMPDLSLIEDVVVCKGQSVTLTAKKGLKYIWSTGATTPSITVTTDGNYAVTATNGECDASNSADVAFIDFKPTIIGDTKVCQGNEAIMIAKDAITYLWSTGQTDDKISVFPQTTTTYVVTATYLGCDKTIPWTISVTETSVKMTASKTEICAGESVILTAADGKSYTWNNGQVGNSITVSPTATATYSFSVGGGICPFKVATEIKVGTALASPAVISLGNTTFCQGGETVLVAPPDMTSYLWSNGATTQTAKITTAGSYIVTVTKDGCKGTSAATAITVNPSPNATITSATGAAAICDGATLKLNAPAGLDAYFWSNNENTQSVNVIQAGTYSVTVSDSKGCIGVSVPFIVGNSVKPSVNAGNDAAICAGSSTNLSASASGASSPYTYSWSPSTGLNSSNIANPVANPSNTTTYSVTVIDSKGCPNADAVIVTVNPKPSVNTGSDVTICAGSPTTLTSNTSSGTTPYVYNWTPATGLSAVNVANPVANPSNTTTYVLSVTDSKGCTSGDNIVVNVIALPAIPTVNVNKNTLTSSAVTGNQWFLNGQAIAGATAQTYIITKDGKYSVKVTSATGNCSSISTELNLKVIAAKDLLDELAFRIFPNPLEDYLTVQISAAEAKYLEITDVLGQVILSQDILINQNFEQRFTTNEWAQGAYFIKIKDKTQQVIGVRKVIKL